jgi:hypothetical protein
MVPSLAKAFALNLVAQFVDFYVRFVHAFTGFARIFWARLLAMGVRAER